MQIEDYVFLSKKYSDEYSKLITELDIRETKSLFVYSGEISFISILGTLERFAIIRLLPEIEKIKLKAFGCKFSVGKYITDNAPSWYGTQSPINNIYLFFIPWDEVSPGFLHKG
jgi:hypothetical protein